MDPHPPPVPPGHDRIGSEGLNFLTVKDGQLYWHGAKLKTESKVRLTLPQGIGAFVITAATVVAAVAASFSAHADLESLKVERSRQTETAPLAPTSMRIAVFSASFESGVSRASTHSATSLANAFRILADNPQATAVLRAYTDGTGSAEFNQRLAEQRAANIRQYLTGNGVAPERITIQVPAADSPRADNATLQGRHQNRRVEIEILSPPIPLTS